MRQRLGQYAKDDASFVCAGLKRSGGAVKDLTEADTPQFTTTGRPMKAALVAPLSQITVLREIRQM